MIVLDSSFLVAFHNARDVHHQAALRVMEGVRGGRWGRALLPEYVFLEVVTVLAARRGLDVAVRVGHVLVDAADIDFVPGSLHFTEAWRVFREQARGAGLSFADAAIVAVARARGARHVATFDAGFRSVDDLVLVPAR
jgi:predicted nucleic acid-binding protein